MTCDHVEMAMKKTVKTIIYQKRPKYLPRRLSVSLILRGLSVCWSSMPPKRPGPIIVHLPSPVQHVPLHTSGSESCKFLRKSHYLPSGRHVCPARRSRLYRGQGFCP